MREVKVFPPNAGLTYMIGNLKSKGILTPRRRILETLQVIDPIGVEERKKAVIV